MMIFKKIKCIIFVPILIFLSVAFSLNVFGQTSSDILVSNESSCGEIGFIFDILKKKANENPGSLVILIARLGDGEKSKKYNERRLTVVKAGISAFDSYPAERIIKTQGERVKEKGQVEMYIGGRSVAVFKAARRKNFKNPSGKECEA